MDNRIEVCDFLASRRSSGTAGSTSSGSTRWGVIKRRAGDTVHTPPSEEHWHGGTADSMICIAVLEGIESGDGTTWLEPVTDEQYAIASQS
jgi:hypothetical protein